VSVDRLSIGDLMMLWSEEPATPMHIGLAGILDGRPSADDLRATVLAALDRAPSLRRRLHLTGFGRGRPVWVDEDSFDLGRHLVQRRLSAEQAAEFPSWAATAATEPLDRHHPLWRIVVATGLADDRSGLVFVSHHAMADGLELGRLAAALMDGGAVPAPVQRQPTPPPTQSQLVRDAIARRATGTWNLLFAANRGTRPRLVRELRDGFRSAGHRAPDIGLPSPRTGDRRMGLRSWELDRLRSIAHTHRVSINDVALTMIAHGIRELLSSRGVGTDNLTLRTSIPLGSPPGLHNVAGSPIVIDLPIDLTPEHALRQIAAQTNTAKISRDRHRSTVADSELAPRFLVRLSMVWLRRHGREHINLYVTNVPGPGEPLTLAGCELTSAFPLPPLIAGVPLAVGVLSYCGRLCIAVNTIPAVDTTTLTDGLDSALDSLG
jgi:WS/DGAT/MGAT family acyltransferase